MVVSPVDRLQLTVVPDEAANKILMLRAIQLKASSRRLDWARGLPLIKSRHLMQCPHIIMKRGKTGKGKAEKQETEVRSQETEEEKICNSGSPPYPF